jgi:tetratricopeptide (TPR) repeat protein
VARGLGVEIVPEARVEPAVEDSVDIEANQNYLIGHRFELKFYRTKDTEDFDKCIEHYTRALEVDPELALAYWRMGNIYEHRFVRENKPGYREQMYEYFQRAHEIDPGLAEANVGIGWKYFNMPDLDEAYRFFKRAFDKDPNNAEINFHVGSFLRSIGLYEQALMHYDRALALNPVPGDYIWHALRADCYSWTGRRDEAIVMLEEALEMDPDPELHYNYVELLIQQGNRRQARAELAEAWSIYGESKEYRQHHALFYAVSGDRESALGLLAGDEMTFLPLFTSVYSLLGMKDEAIANIRYGIEMGFEIKQWYLYTYLFLLHNPFYDGLRDDVRFREIMRSQQAEYEQRLMKFGDL